MKLICTMLCELVDFNGSLIAAFDFDDSRIAACGWRWYSCRPWWLLCLLRKSAPSDAGEKRKQKRKRKRKRKRRRKRKRKCKRGAAALCLVRRPLLLFLLRLLRFLVLPLEATRY